MHGGRTAIYSAFQFSLFQGSEFPPFYRQQSNNAREETLSGGLQWLKTIYGEFPVSIVQNSFMGSGCYYEDGILYSKETESNSPRNHKAGKVNVLLPFVVATH